MITILRDVYRPEHYVRDEFEGPLIDYLTANFPEGFGSDRSVVFLNQEQLDVENYDAEIRNDDNVVIITTVPEGLETATIIALVSLAVNVLFAAISYITAPKAKTTAKGGRTYDISSGQNVPALGQPIAEHFGQTWFYPDVASQPYTFYTDNNQYLHEILLIGAGDYRIDGIRFGETDFSVIPPGLVEYRVFPPQEVQNRYGYIYSQYGVREDVITSTDVQGISMTRNSNASWFGKRHNSEAKMKGTVTPDRFTVGQQVNLLTSDYNPTIGQTVPINSISGYTVYVDFMGTSSQDAWWQMADPVEDDGWRGWFTATIVGKKADVIVLDFLMPQGCYYADAEGAMYQYYVEFDVVIQQIDDNDANIGAEVVHRENITARSKSTLRRTFTYPVTLGRYKVRVRRITMDSPLNRIVSDLTWEGLKAICYNTPNQYAYGNVTLLAVKVKASERLSSRSDKISVQATRILPTVASDFTVKAPTINPVDAFAHIIREVQTDGIDVGNLKALGTKWANTNGFNYRFTEQEVVYSALQKIAYSHRATPEAYAYKIGMRQDVAKPFDQFIVSDEQMIKDSYKTGIKLAQSSGVIDGYRVGFQDPTGVRQLFAVYPSGSLTPAELPLDGCTSQATALQHGAYLYAKYLSQGRVVEFTTEWDALAFSIGDRIQVLDSVIDRVSTARVVSYVGKVLTLDTVLEAPSIQVKLRDQYGAPSDMLTGSMTGNVLTLTTTPVFPVFGLDSGQESTTVMLAETKDYARSYQVQTITPDSQTVQVTAASYSSAPYQYPIPGEV